MPVLNEHAVFIFITQLGVIVLAARVLSEIAKRLGLPIIVGEVSAGILLGPVIFGHFYPNAYQSLFPQEGFAPYLLQGISWLCVLFLLIITGLEIDLRAALRQGKQGVSISLCTLIFSFTGTYLISYFLPKNFYPEGIPAIYVQLLLSLALSVIAVPVIAKILFDLKILRSAVGLNILTTGIVSDIWEWTLLAVIISYITHGSYTLWTILKPLLIMITYLTFTLTIGHRLVDKFLDMIGYKNMDITVALSLLFSLGFLNCTIAHLLGIHVVFGAFIAGLMAGESEKITPYMRQWLQDFVFAIFAPIFFVWVGMQLNFNGIANWMTVLLLLIVSSACRIGGAFFGSLLGGLGRKNALAVSFGINTQGSVGIIIGLIGYEMGIFNDVLFTTIVVICVLTSLSVGPLLKWAIKGVRRPLAKFFDREHVFLDIEGKNKKHVIKTMSQLMARRTLITNASSVERAIWEREESLSTAIGEGVALPHARIPDLKLPILCFFRLKNPVDFGSPDDQPVRLLFLELTDQNDDGMQLNLITQVARFVASEKNRNRLLECKREEDIHHILSFDETV